MLGRTDRRWRSVAILGLMCLLAAASVVRLAYWQVAQAPQLQTRAMAQLQVPETEHALRGDIFDRNHRLLATTGFRDTLAAWPNLIPAANRQALIARVTEILQLDSAGQDRLVAELDPTDPYAIIRRELTEAQSRAIRVGIADRTLQGLGLLPHAVRIYPNPGGQPGTTLASQLLGFVRASDGTGQYGIEGQYDAILAGRPKTVAMAQDRGRSFESSAQVIESGADGEDITISIDLSLQLQLEKELYAAWVSDKSKRVTGLVMDPDTGELLAWASVPGYDANQSAAVATTHPELLLDPIVRQPYEPGSVMKMLTATSALENKVVSPGSRIMDSSVLRFGPEQSIHNWDKKGMGRIAFRDVIAYSRNVGVSRVAARLGRTTARAATNLYKTWQKLGIGVRTGVDLPGELPGMADDPKRTPWVAIDLANRAFGQSVMATPVQLATAFTPMINGGMRVQPHFLLSIGGRAQDVVPPRRVITRKVANQLLGILDHVTASVPWYAQGSLIRHYQVGGKTGTAEIYRPGTGWDRNTYNFTFVGYVGGDRPAAVVAVHIDEANSISTDEIQLNVTSYQLFRQVARAIIHTQYIGRSSDPNAGQPEPGSAAARATVPTRSPRHTSARAGGR